MQVYRKQLQAASPSPAIFSLDSKILHCLFLQKWKVENVSSIYCPVQT
jgi:hypothetical protein